MTRRAPLLVPFATPTFQVGSSVTNTHDSVTSAGSVSGVAGDRVVVLAGHARGSIISPASGIRTLSDITGSDDFSGLDLSDWTSHEDITSQISGQNAGVRLIARSHVLTGSATGTITVVWSNTCWVQWLMVTVLPACSIIDGDDAVRNDDGATLDLDFTASLGADDLALVLGAQLLTNDFAIPASHTTTGTIDNANARFRGSYKNGSPADPTQISGLYTSSALPKAGVGLILRRDA